MTFIFVLPIIYINFDIQTKFKVNQTQIGHSIPKKTPKTHQGGHISKVNAKSPPKVIHARSISFYLVCPFKVALDKYNHLTGVCYIYYIYYIYISALASAPSRPPNPTLTPQNQASSIKNSFESPKNSKNRVCLQ